MKMYAKEECLRNIMNIDEWTVSDRASSSQSFFLLRPRSNLSWQEIHFKILLFILVLQHKVFFARILKSFQSRAWTNQYFSTGTHSPWESCVTLERSISSEYKSNLTNTLWSLRFQTNVNSRNRYTSSLRAAFPKFRLGVCKDFYFTRTAAKSVSWFSRPLHEVQTTIIWTLLEKLINKTANVTIHYLNLRTHWNAYCLILSRNKVLGHFFFSFSTFHSFRRTNKCQNWEGKIAPW